MRESLEPAAVGRWLARYSDFGDGVIRSLAIEEGSGAAGRVATLVVDAQDTEYAGAWTRVTMTIDGMSDFRLSQGPGDYFVIFALSVRVTDASAEVSQDEGAWYIRGRRLSWSVEAITG